MTRFLRPHRRLAWAALACMLAGSALSILGPLAVGVLLDEGVGRHDLRRVVFPAFIFLAIEVARQTADALQTRVLRRLGQDVARDLRTKLFAHLQEVSTSYLLANAPGRVSALIVQDAAALGEAIAGGAVGMLRDIGVFLGVGAAVFYVHPFLGGVCWGSAVLLGVPAVLVRRAAERSASRAREGVAVAQAVIEENAAGLKVIRLYGLEEERGARFSRANAELVASALSTLRVRTAFEGAGTVASALALSLVLWFGGREMAAGTLSVGLFLALVQYVPYLLGAVQGVMDKTVQLLAARAAGCRILDVLDLPKGLSLRTRPSPPAREEGLVVSELHFGYREGQEVLRGVSFSLRPGERAAIVGPTGAGKTTLARLLARLHDPRAGEIRLDGRDLCDIPPEELRRLVAYLPQEPAFYSGTIRENVGLGARSVEEACERIGATSLIARFPGGYETPISDAHLSAGERQLLALARVMARNPRVVILDEPTAHLDLEAESAVLTALMTLLEGRTAVLIAHRRTTLRLAHRILAIKDGKVAVKEERPDLVRQA
jgi:ABC-type multidrug transport system fused ATPase/permease subunit